MKYVRYFSKLVDPNTYARGYGLRGRWIAFINRIRVLLETHLVFQILRIDAERHGWDTEDVLKEAKKTTELPPWITADGKFVPPTTLQRTPSSGFKSHAQKTSSRYQAGRKNAPDHKPQPLERSPMVTTLAVAARRSNREIRYAPGRQHVVYDDHFEPVGDD